jgi:uncharacterized protein (TIRG00374 family)
LAVSAVAVYLLARAVDWNAVLDGIREAQLALIAVAALLLLPLFFLRSYRWTLFYRYEDGVTTWTAFKALNIGYMAGNVLPLQLGEVARAYALGEMAQVSKVRVLSTAAAERIIDLCVLLAAAAVLGPFISLSTPAAAVLWTAVGAATIALAALLLAILDRPRVERISEVVLRLIPARFHDPFLRLRDATLDGVVELASVRRFCAVLVWTAASWALAAGVIYVLIHAMNLSLPVTAAPLLLIVTTLAFFVPSSPGAVGVYDAAAVTTLVTAFDVDRNAATSYALVAHAVYLIPASALGFWFAWSLGWPKLTNPGEELAGPSNDAPAVVPEPVRPA